MSKTVLVNAATQIVGYDRRLNARPYSSGPDPERRIDGLTFGVASMSNDAPHGGERHLAGDEVLHLVSGQARIVFRDHPENDVTIKTGDTVIVPKGLWHRVEILEPCYIVYLSPGKDNEILPLDSET